MTVETSQAADNLFAQTPETKTWQGARGDREVIERIDQTLDLIAEATSAAIGLYPVDHFDVSIIIPVFNQRHRLPLVLERIAQVMPVTTEAIVVDDGSTDGTSEWLAQLPPRNNLKIIQRRRHHGTGSAIRVGIRHSGGRVISIQDANLDSDPADLLRVIWPVIDGDAEVVYGSRYLAAHEEPSIVERISNWLLTSACNTVTGLGLTDMESCHRAFDGDLLRSISLQERGQGFDSEITAKIANRNARMIEVPTYCHTLGTPTSNKHSWRDRFHALQCLWNYRRG